jgi:hypothetical protein
MSGSLQVPRCSSTPDFQGFPDIQTVSVLGLNDLSAAFSGMTLTFSTSKYDSFSVFWFEDMYTTQTLPHAATKTPSPLDYMNQIDHGAPFCVNAANVTCPSLFNSSRSCWSESFPPGPQGCYCAALLENNCTAICQSTPEDRSDYFKWVIHLCSHNYTAADNSSITANFTSRWPEYKNRTAGLREDLLVWPWRLVSGNSTTVDWKNGTNSTFNLSATNTTSFRPLIAADPVCSHSDKIKLVSMAIVNVITAISSLLARRDIASIITRAHCGKPGSRGWPLAAILAVGLNLLATIINARVALRTPGYTESLEPSLKSLFLFWAARPRLSWIATALVTVEKVDLIYISTGVSALFAEVFQQCVGAYAILWILISAAKRGYYNIGGVTYSFPAVWALTMYVGAMMWMLGFAFMLGVSMWMLPSIIKLWRKTGVSRHRRTTSNPSLSQANIHSSIHGHQDDKAADFDAPIYFGEPVAMAQTELQDLMPFNDAVESMGLSEEVVSIIPKSFSILVLPFVGQWIFWVGFVKHASVRYV